MDADPTKIDILSDPIIQRMKGVTYHGNMRFDVPFISEITPEIWQGGCVEGLVLPKFIDNVVSLYPWESYQVDHKLKSSLTLRMYDSLDQSSDDILMLAKWVLSRPGVTLVHCQAGLNRSSLVVAIALRLQGISSSDAIATLREKRSPACLSNSAFEEYVMTMEV